MTVLKILQYPDIDLTRKAEPVTDFGPAFQKIVDDMFETHYAQENCAALAATQLDMPNPPHVTVIDFSDKKDQPLCLVNGKIIHQEGERTEHEGCMSVGLGFNVYEKITRAAKITVEAQDRHGKTFTMDADDFMAKCIQHELDHLDGRIYLDYLSRLKRKRLEEKLDKSKRRYRKIQQMNQKAEDNE